MKEILIEGKFNTAKCFCVDSDIYDTANQYNLEHANKPDINDFINNLKRNN